MPLDTRTYDLAEERDRLTREMEESAQRQADLPPEAEGAKASAEEGQLAERYRTGVAWAMAEWDEDAIKFGVLTNGERHRMADTVESTPYEATDCYVAAATVDAPYLAHDPEAITQEEFVETVRNVLDLRPEFVDWANSRISDLSRVDGDTGKSYRTLVRERQTQED